LDLIGVGVPDGSIEIEVDSNDNIVSVVDGCGVME
jgi:hypothetical protein